MAGLQGLDRLQRHLADAQAAMSALKGEVGKLQFDPGNPVSIEAAVLTMERMIDQKGGQYSSNPIVGPLIAKSKAAFATAIRAQASRK